MQRRNNNRVRPGTTLLEVLVSIFVMGIGLLALLTLFPLGAADMAQAIRDDRVAHLAANAQAIAIARDLRHDAILVGTAPNFQGTFDNPYYPNPAPVGGLPNLAAIPGYDGPSYSVFVDAIGVSSALNATAQQWVGDLLVPGGALPRRMPSFVTFAGAAAFNRVTQSSFAFLDEINFAADGTPDVATSGGVEREPTFSYALLLRRPRRAVPSVVQMSVVVYSGRPSNLPLAENTYDQAFFNTTNNANTIILQWGGKQRTPPQLRSGDWIMDASVDATTHRPHGYFYRVTEVNDLGGNRMELTVEGSLKDFKPNQVTPGVAIVMEGVIEVIDKGTGWLP